MEHDGLGARSLARRTMLLVLAALVPLWGCGGDGLSAGRDIDPSQPRVATQGLPVALCDAIPATNAEHVARGRAYTETVTFLFFSVTTYYATGTREDLGTSEAAVSTCWPGMVPSSTRKAMRLPSGL